MFFTRALRSTASIALEHTSQHTARTAVRSGRRIGESWAVTETKRLAPTLVMYGAFITSVLGWPLLWRKVHMGIGIHGLNGK